MHSNGAPNPDNIEQERKLVVFHLFCLPLFRLGQMWILLMLILWVNSLNAERQAETRRWRYSKIKFCCLLWVEFRN